MLETRPSWHHALNSRPSLAPSTARSRYKRRRQNRDFDLGHVALPRLSGSTTLSKSRTRSGNAPTLKSRHSENLFNTEQLKRKCKSYSKRLGTGKRNSRLGETALVTIESAHPNACLLADVYHLHKGGSGFVGVNRRALAVFGRSFPLEYPEIEALVVLQRRRFRFEEIPCKMRPRTTGATSITPVKSLYYIAHVLLGVFVNVLKYERRLHRRGGPPGG